MRFTVTQTYAADPDAVARAYAEPALYAAFGDLPRAGQPDVLAHEVDGDVVGLRVRWVFTAPLSAAARAVVDPDRLTWVEHATHDLAARTTTFSLIADHYADRFSCQGTVALAAAGAGGSTRTTNGELKIKAFLVGATVEEAIVDGLKDQLRAEVAIVEAFVNGDPG